MFRSDFGSSKVDRYFSSDDLTCSELYFCSLICGCFLCKIDRYMSDGVVYFSFSIDFDTKRSNLEDEWPRGFKRPQKKNTNQTSYV